MLNIVIPMAGRGRRFLEAGFRLPKPLIPVDGVPVIEYVIANLRPARSHRFIFLCLAEHIAAHGLDAILQRLAPGCAVLPVNEVTGGAACTVLLAKDLIDNGEPLMIANSDQLVDADIDAYLDAAGEADGLIMTMRADDPKWSFVRLDGAGRAVEVAEKRVISNEATVGVYNFRRGCDFVEAAEGMIGKGLRVNGEFYVAPVYNELIAAGRSIAVYNVGAEFDGMYGLGIPADLDRFAKLNIAGKILKKGGRP
ncbi:MAG TPA: glycosyl transferase family 2 [Elusimicrobia bacterium]|nr:MAG: glycosyl transferase family 2 [Elusimicrobia bacterium GWD2_63_28]HCC49261.1 glycosyl transferase family 2 [Elusimicrobiota bacterium]